MAQRGHERVRVGRVGAVDEPCARRTVIFLGAVVIPRRAGRLAGEAVAASVHLALVGLLTWMAHLLSNLSNSCGYGLRFSETRISPDGVT